MEGGEAYRQSLIRRKKHREDLFQVRKNQKNDPMRWMRQTNPAKQYEGFMQSAAKSGLTERQYDKMLTNAFGQGEGTFKKGEYRPGLEGMISPTPVERKIDLSKGQAIEGLMQRPVGFGPEAIEKRQLSDKMLDIGASSFSKPLQLEGENGKALIDYIREDPRSFVNTMLLSSVAPVGNVAASVTGNHNYLYDALLAASSNTDRGDVVANKSEFSSAASPADLFWAGSLFSPGAFLKPLKLAGSATKTVARAERTANAARTAGQAATDILAYPASMLLGAGGLGSGTNITRAAREAESARRRFGALASDEQKAQVARMNEADDYAGDVFDVKTPRQDRGLLEGFEVRTPISETDSPEDLAALAAIDDLVAHTERQAKEQGILGEISPWFRVRSHAMSPDDRNALYRLHVQEGDDYVLHADVQNPENIEDIKKHMFNTMRGGAERQKQYGFESQMPYTHHTEIPDEIAAGVLDTMKGNWRVFDAEGRLIRGESKQLDHIIDLILGGDNTKLQYMGARRNARKGNEAKMQAQKNRG